MKAKCIAALTLVPLCFLTQPVTGDIPTPIGGGGSETIILNYCGMTTISPDHPEVFESVPDMFDQLKFDSFNYGSDGSPCLEFDKLDADNYSIRMNFLTVTGQSAWVDYLVNETLGTAVATNCSNNFVLASSFTALYDKGLGGQGSIYVEDSAGNVYRPKTPTQLSNVLASIRVNGRTVTKLIFKGHGSASSVSPFSDSDYFITCPGGVGGNRVIIACTDPTVPMVDITDVMNDVTDGGTTIRIRGCFTKELADDMESACGGEPDVKGAIRYVIGIPFTDIGFGVYR